MANKKTEKNPAALDFAARLRAVREAKELSVIDVATAAGMSYSAYARLERGDREPSLSTILRLMAALECPSTDLIGE